MKSLELWRSVTTAQNWQLWLNKNGNDGTLLDTEDNVSFIHKDKKKAIKITYESDGQFDFEYWYSEFEGTDEKISVLNIIFSNFEKAKFEFRRLLEN